MSEAFRAVIAAVREHLPAGVSDAELHAFLAENASRLRGDLQTQAPRPEPVIPPGTPLWDHFHHQGAPGQGERGWRPNLDAEATADGILTTALRYLDEPEVFWMREAAQGVGAGDPDDLPDLLGVPWRWSSSRRREVSLRAIQLAMEVEGRALPMSGAPTPDGLLPHWLAVGLLADQLTAHAPLRLVNIDKTTAAAFIEAHHSMLPCINLRGILYAIGVRVGGRLVAVATAGHPTGRWQRIDPRNILELTRLASDGSTKNAASMLVARLLDLRERSRRGRPDEPALFVTYQVTEAEGAVYRALQDKGLRPVARVPGRKPGGARKAGRLTPCQQRTEQTTSLSDVDKVRWEAR